MYISTRLHTPSTPVAQKTSAPAQAAENSTFEGAKDTFVSGAALASKCAVAALAGFGLGSAASGGGFGGGTVGLITGAGTGMFITAPMGNGKGGEGLIYPVIGAAVGGVAGAVVGAVGGSYMPWVGAAAAGLAALQTFRG